jgi:hypothetical protein
MYRSLTGFVALGIFVFALTFANADPKTKPAVSSASLRVWVGSLGAKKTLRVVIRGNAKKPSGIEIADKIGAFRFGEYDTAPGGAGVVDIFDGDSGKAPVVSRNIHFAANTFWTLLIQEIGSELCAEVIDDTPVSNAALTILRVRNLAPSVRKLTIDAGPLLHVQFASPGASLEVRGLPTERLQVETSGVEVSGAALQWTNEIDLVQYPRTTLLIFPDPYGRIRPRVVLDARTEAQSQTSPSAP